MNDVKRTLQLIQRGDYNLDRQDSMVIREIVQVIKYLIDTKQIQKGG